MSTPSRLGDFEVGEEIGRGGFGVVYRARQVSLDRPVAVKVLYRHLIHTDEQISRFEREARAAARLDHPALVSVFAWGETDEDFFIAQRLVGRGRTLADELAELRQSGQPPKGHFRRMAEICARMAEGLQHAHERGIVHRDVKPSNILLDEHGQPCLGDFGLAKVEDGLELSRTGDFAGSPFYMSPEQADSRRGPIDQHTDVYSLGVTLYEMLTLTQPFKGATSHEIVRRILSEEPLRPARLEARVPQDLETICLKAMEKQPSLRYASAGGMAADLHAFLEGEPIDAVPISTTRRVLRSARRHREPLALALLGLLIVVGGGLALREMKDATHELEQSNRQTAGEAARAAIQERRADEIDQIQEATTPMIQQAAARNEGQEVSRLLDEQKAYKDFLTENYDWVQGQVGALSDSEDVRKVATGIATGGLLGGLQGLQQIVAGRQVAGERDAVLGELERRMKAVDERLSAAPGVLPQAAPAVAAAPVPPAFWPRVVAGDSGHWLWLTACGPLLLPAPSADPDVQPALPETGAGLDAPLAPAPAAQDVGAGVPRARLDGDGALPALRFPRLPR
jgi:serine/threonine protein kinase